MSLNVATILREAVAQHPDKPCLLVDGISVTYADVERGSARAAAGLLALGLVRGDMVAVQLENSADFVFCYFGILRAGLTMVPLNPLLREPEVRHVMTDSGARALLTSSSRVDEVARAAGDVPVFVRGSGELPGVPHPRQPLRRPGVRRRRPDQLGGHRGAPLHQRHDGAAQGSRAHPPAAPDERQHLGRPLRVRPLGRLVGGRAVLPRLRPESDRGHGPLRQHHDRAAAVRDRDRAGGHGAGPCLDHVRRADHVLRPPGGGRDGPRPLRVPTGGVRRRRDPRRDPA